MRCRRIVVSLGVAVVLGACAERAEPRPGDAGRAAIPPGLSDAGTSVAPSFEGVEVPPLGASPLSVALPSTNWVSPEACATQATAEYCAPCWAWTDGGAPSVGRNELDDRFGRSLATADFNADGFPDLAVGAPGETVGGVGAVGAVYLFLGTSGGYQPWRVLAASRFVAASADLRFGFSVLATDADGDGSPDVVVGLGPGASTPGVAVAFGDGAGFPDAVFVPASALDPDSQSDPSFQFGAAMVLADVDGDGQSEVVVGAPSYPVGGLVDSGAVFLFRFDSMQQPVALGRWDLNGAGLTAAAGDLFGASLAAVPPARLAVGAPGRGEVSLWEFASVVVSHTSSLGLAAFGTSLAAGDVGGTADADLLVGGVGSNVVEIAGSGLGLTSFDMRAGTELHPIAVVDLDGDGYLDVVAQSRAATRENLVLTYEGTATFAFHDGVSLQSGAVEPQDQLGAAFGVGDFDGDFLTEVLLGAPAPGSGAGRVYRYAAAQPADWFRSAGLATTEVVHQERALTGCDTCAVHSYPDGEICDLGAGAEICVGLACVTRACGDGYRQTGLEGHGWVREACDDANATDGDSCAADCSMPLRLVISSRGDLTPGGPADPFRGADGPSERPPSVAVDGHGDLLFVYVADTVYENGQPGVREVRARRADRYGNLERGPPATMGDDPSPIHVVASQPLGIGWDPEPTAAGLPGGGFVVAWTDPVEADEQADVVYRLVSGSSAATPSVGPALIAHRSLDPATSVGPQLEAAVVPTASGFAIHWTDMGGLDAGPGRAVVQQRTFTDKGLPRGAELTLSGASGGWAQQPVSAATPTGEWMVVWTEDRPSFDGLLATPRILARRTDAFGNVESFVVSPVETGYPLFWSVSPAVGVLENGDFVVAWVERRDDFLGDIVARVIPRTGDPLSQSVEPVSPLPTPDPDDPRRRQLEERGPSVTGWSGSDYVAAWESGGHRRGAALRLVGSGSLPPEGAELLADPGYLSGALQGDVTVLRTERGVWVAWSEAPRDGAPHTPGADRSFFAYLLPLN